MHVKATFERRSFLNLSQIQFDCIKLTRAYLTVIQILILTSYLLTLLPLFLALQESPGEVDIWEKSVQYFKVFDKNGW